MDKIEPIRRPPWRVRRRIVIATLVFCASGVLYLLLFGTDTRLNETLAQGLMLLAGSTIGAYVFGASWDDRNVMMASSGDARSRQAGWGQDHAG